jgi:hypothetical protein
MIAARANEQLATAEAGVRAVNHAAVSSNPIVNRDACRRAHATAIGPCTEQSTRGNAARR